MKLMEEQERLLEKIDEEFQVLSREYKIGIKETEAPDVTVGYDFARDMIAYNPEQIKREWEHMREYYCPDLAIETFVRELFGHELGHKKEMEEIGVKYKKRAREYHAIGYAPYVLLSEAYANRVNPLKQAAYWDCLRKGMERLIGQYYEKEELREVLRDQLVEGEVSLMYYILLPPFEKIERYLPEVASNIRVIKEMMERIKHPDDIMRYLDEIDRQLDEMAWRLR